MRLPGSVEINLRSFHRNEWWFKTQLFCPICGKRNVWEEDSAGDYYAGPAILCLDCGGTMQHPREKGGCADEERLPALRALSPTPEVERVKCGECKAVGGWTTAACSRCKGTGREGIK